MDQLGCFHVMFGSCPETCFVTADDGSVYPIDVKQQKNPATTLLVQLEMLP